MDFLAAIQKKVREMEEQARLLQSMESEQAQQQQRQARKQRAKQQKQQQKQQKGQRQQQNQRSLVSPDEAFETPHCATQGGSGGVVMGATTPLGLQPRLVDDLHGRLDEAFLLSEILGRPRCERGWTADQD